MITRLFTTPSIRQTRAIAFRLVTFALLCGWYGILTNTAAAVGENQSEEARELLPNAPIEREIQGNETHFYKITVATGTYLRLFITPQNINLDSKLLNPDGSDDEDVAYIPAEHGLRIVSLVAEVSGSYRLEIRLTEKKDLSMELAKAQAGRYQVKIEELRPATAQDKIRVAAEKAENAGRTLVNFAGSAEQRRQGLAKYEEALALWRELGDNQGASRTLRYLGIQLERMGEPQKALKYWKQSIEMARTMGDRYQEANLIMGIGIIYRSLGEVQKALDSFNQARQIFKDSSKRYGEALAIHAIGTTLMQFGEWQNALPYLEEALPTMTSTGDRYSQANILNFMGWVQHFQGNRQQAIEFHNQALAIARAGKVAIEEALSLDYLGNIYLELGDKQKALAFYQQSLEKCKAQGRLPCEAGNLRLIGDLTYSLGDHQKALEFLNRSLQLFRSTWERSGEAMVLHSLAEVNTALGNFDEARKLLEQALDIRESLRAKVISQEVREAIFSSAQSSFALYIDLLMQLHKQQPAAGYAALALQASERARARSLLDLLLQSRADIREGAPQNLLELERALQQQLNAKAATRARLLSDNRTEAQAASFDKEIAGLTARFREVEVQIRHSSPRYAALTQPQPLAAAEIQQQLDKETVLLEFALGDKQSWLWAVTNSSIATYQLPSRQEISIAARQVNELLTARQPRRGESDAQYQARIKNADGRLQTSSAALSQLLFGQLAAKLQGDWKNKRLVIVASGALEYVPFAALPVPKSSESGVRSQESGVRGITRTEINQDQPLSLASRLLPANDRQPAADYQPLIAQHEIINLPSVSALAAIRREAPGRKAIDKTIAVIADPVFEVTDPRVLNAQRKSSSSSIIASVRSGDEGQPTSNTQTATTTTTPNADLVSSLRSFESLNQRGGFSRLPFSREEADAIASLAPKNSFIKATDFLAARSFATGGDLARFRIVHFATHGLLNSERPELSGLVLSLVDEQGKSQDGFLRMHEIYNLNLPADLIVLSACQTALGKQIRGEGLVGLTRGFMYAGAQRVVASLWQVDDLATAELMKRFYRGMLKEGMRPAQALRAAQLEMMKQGRWSSPYFWAAFTIQGEWR